MSYGDAGFLVRAFARPPNSGRHRRFLLLADYFSRHDSKRAPAPVTRPGARYFLYVCISQERLGNSTGFPVELAVIKVGVESALFHELVMAAGLDDVAVAQDQNLIRVADR